MTNDTRLNTAIDQNSMRAEYESYLETRHHVVNDIKSKVDEILISYHSSPTVNGRIKSFSSYYGKYLNLLRNGDNSPKIMDLLGIRVICPFIEDLGAVENLINQNLNVVELERKGHFTFKEFGYESIHLLIEIPAELIAKYGDCGTDAVEIQLRTILQDAWAEVEHELFYKKDENFTLLSEPLKRRLAAANASLSLADSIFQEIRNITRRLNGSLGTRINSFHRLIEESTDGLLFDKEREEEKTSPEESIPIIDEYAPLDDLLISALRAHNKKHFTEAIAYYTRILEINSDPKICTIIYKHRGMAYFTQSRHAEAIEDFSKSLETDEKSYKSAYYRGIAKSVIKEYQGAIEDFSLSLAIKPDQPYTLYRRGQAYYHLEDYPAALADCEASLALEPESTGAERFRSLLLDKLKMLG